MDFKQQLRSAIAADPKALNRFREYTRGRVENSPAEFVRHFDKDLAALNGQDIQSAIRERSGNLCYHLPQYLGMLGPQKVYAQFGREALLYTVFMTSPEDFGVEGMRLLQEKGETPQLIEKAHWSTWGLSVGKIYEDYEKNYRLYQMLPGIVLAMDYKSILARHVKENVDGLPMAKYAIDSSFSRAPEMGNDPKWEGTDYRFHLDGPCGIVMMYDGRPAAVTSFFFKRSDTLKILQFQGIRPVDRKRLGAERWDNLGCEERDELGKPGRDYPIPEKYKRTTKGIQKLEWKDALLEMAQTVARALGASAVCIVGGARHPMHSREFRYRDGQPHLPLEQALKAYDEFAQKRGFIFQDDGNWYSELKARDAQ